MITHIVVTGSALDAALVSGGFSSTTGLPLAGNGIHSVSISDQLIGFRTTQEREPTYFCAVGTQWINLLLKAGGMPADIFRRIARVLKGLESPPVHLPRQWSEYHHRNLLAFFALPRETANLRWIVELGGADKIASFDFLSSTGDEVDLPSFVPSDLGSKFAEAATILLQAVVSTQNDDATGSLAQEVDLQAIGSGSVVAGRTYEDWERHLTEPQRNILNNNVDSSVRIVGPAGSGKTLSLCMRAIQISRDPSVTSRGKRILVATHSWAMSERIDGILSSLNAGLFPEGITVFPLLSLLELHAGHIGQRRTEIIGDDSTDGRLRSLEIIGSVVSKIEVSKFPDLSEPLMDGLLAGTDGRSRLDLVLNLYEEISGVLTASGVAPDDPNSIQDYISSKREDWMPPFVSASDRAFAIAVYRHFIQSLVDRAAITTDQFILDSIRVLETFTWRMKKETEGYDYVIVDELQLFDPQERSSLELLGRSRRGVPFVTAEDPSQGVFAALNIRHAHVDNVPVYLDTVHRFNRGIFQFINFLYQQFPLNAVPLKISGDRDGDDIRPNFYYCLSEVAAILVTVDTVKRLSREGSGQRICVVTLGDVDADLVSRLQDNGLLVTRLESFDDVEQLSYRKRSIVVSPWQFIGGTQFSHVLVLALGINEQTSQFGRLREMIAIYLSCSRAADTLNIICSTYIPPIISEACDQGLLQKREVP